MRRAVSASLVAVAIAVASACVLVTSPAAAQAAPEIPTAPPPDKDAPLTMPVQLRHSVLADGIATAALAGALVTWRVSRSSIVSSECTICDGSQPGKVNGVDDFFRDAFRRNDASAAATASNVLAYGVAPAMGFAFTYAAAAADHRADEAPLNGMLVLEASLAAIAVNEAFGAFLRRERPDVHALDPDAKAAALSETSSLDSFPSGQTASIMAITSATATIATLRGYRLAPLIWIVGTTLGLTSTYLGIAAEQHYFTDHVAGAAIGLSVGAAIPLLFHPRAGERPNVIARTLEGTMLTSSAVPGGRVVSVGATF